MERSRRLINRKSSYYEEADKFWVCHLCSKKNAEHELLCAVCGRERVFGEKSFINLASAKPRALHGNNALFYRVDQIEEMIATGFQIQDADSEGWTALHCATKLGRIDLVEAILRLGADVEAEVRGSQWRPLHIAVLQKDTAMVKVLIEAKANLTCRMKEDGRTPLHIACTNGALSIVELLLTAGVDLEQRTENMKETPLHLAVDHNHLEVVELLLLLGADVTAVNEEGYTAMSLAMFAQNRNMQCILRDVGFAKEQEGQELFDKVRVDMTRSQRLLGHTKSMTNKPRESTLRSRSPSRAAKKHNN